jgi:iron complex outermembrane receptor protein
VLSLKPIIVTAQRREQDIQNVPGSITAMNTEELTNRGIDRVIDLQNSIPNFFLGEDTFQWATYSSIRGIAGASRAPGVEKRANYYIDDVYIGRSIAVNQDLFDLERLELLKGPQGTLFGKNTVSGAINITTKRPVNKWEGAIRVEGGNLNYLNSQLVLNAPLMDNKLSARFAGKIMRRDGYVTNLYNNKDMNGQNVIYGRFQIRYLPTQNLDIILSIDALRDRRDRRTFVMALDGVGFDVAPDPREISHDLNEFEHRDIFGSSLNMLYQFDNKYCLRSITAYRKVKNWGNWDEDLSPQPFYVGINESEDSHFTQEIILTSPLFRNYNFVAGLFYFYQNSDQTFGLDGAPEAFPGNLFLLSYGPVKTHSIAGYFHNNFYLNSTLLLSGGLRYTYEYKTLNWSQFNDSDSGAFYVNIENYTDTYSKGVFSPQIGLQFQLQEHLMFYGKTTWGYKSGGFGNHTVASLEHLKLKPEYVVSFEGGIKFTTFNDRLSFNTAAFISKFDDYQTEVWQINSLELLLPVYTNAAKVTSKGFEMELNAIPTNNLTLMASFGYVDARYDEFNSDDPDQDYTGNRLELAPETEYSLSVEYHMPIIYFGTFSIRADYIRKDEYYVDASNAPDFHVPGYELIDAKIGYESYTGSFGVYIWGKNLTDNLYMLVRSQTPVGINCAWYAMPRTFGIGLTYNFL